MITQAQFKAMPDYDQEGNPEKLETPTTAVKAITVTDFSDSNIYYRDVDGVLSSIPRKFIKNARVALGDVITLTAEMKYVSSTSAALDAKAKVHAKNEGKPARSGSNERKPFTMF